MGGRESNDFAGKYKIYASYKVITILLFRLRKGVYLIRIHGLYHKVQEAVTCKDTSFGSDFVISC